jgi:hypothetical protein
VTWHRPRLRDTLLLLAALSLLLGATACGRRARRHAGSSTPAASASPSATATASAPAVPTAPATPIPAEYAALAQVVTQGLDAWQAKLGPASGATGGGTVFGTELLAANANRGPALLMQATLDSVNPMLDRMQQLGIRGVTLNVNFPLLNADYPRSADYLAFYEAVAQRVRAHHMTLSVEQHVVFSGTAFSPVSFDYSKLPFDQFVAQFHTMTQLLIDRLHPDYLTLLSEPDTFAQLTGYASASTPAGAAAWIGRVLDGVQRGTTKIGAGAGSWLPNAATYDEAFARLPLDYIDLHIYPMNATIAGTLQQIAAVSRSTGKPLVIDEVWLQKIGPNDSGGVHSVDAVFLRDNYAFWQPLDTRFLDLVAQYARASGAVYVSPFWSTHFWAYTDYGPATKDLTYAQISQQVNALAYQAVGAGAYTSTGEAYGAIAKR